MKIIGYQVKKRDVFNGFSLIQLKKWIGSEKN